jgi:hypothetical protein
MKKLVVLLVISLLIISAYGQTSGVYCMIKEKYPEHIKANNPSLLGLTTAQINDYVEGIPIQAYDFFNKQTYHFIENGNLYMISYDIIRTMPVERDVHLFCWNGDGTWSIVTDKPIQIDYFKRENDVWILENYYPMHYPAQTDTQPEYGQKVEKLNNGKIRITLVSHINVNNETYSKFYQKIIILTPNGDGTYHPTWDGVKIPLEHKINY